MSAQGFLRHAARRVVPGPLKPPLRQLAIGARERFRNLRFQMRLMDARLHDGPLYDEIRRRLSRPDLDPRIRALLHRLLLDQPRAQREGTSPGDPRAVDVLYVTNRLSPDALKDVIALSEVGNLECAVVSGAELENSEPLTRLGVPVFACQNTLQLASVLLRTRTQVTIGRRGSPEETLVAMLFGSGRFVYRPYDFMDRAAHDASERRVRRSVPPSELERFILRNAVGLSHMHDERTIRRVRRQYAFRGLDVHVRPGCMDAFRIDTAFPKLSEADHEVHLVQATHLAGKGAEGRNGGADEQEGDFVRVLEQGLHLHVFQAPATGSDRSRPPREWTQLAERFPRFHVHPAPAYQDMVRELSRYDFAYSYFPQKKPRRPDQFYGAMANGFYSYLDAGLPVITATDTWPLADLVQEHQIGLVVPAQDLPRLRSMLLETDRAVLNENVARARPSLMHDSRRFVDFVRHVMDGVPLVAAEPTAVPDEPDSIGADVAVASGPPLAAPPNVS